MGSLPDGQSTVPTRNEHHLFRVELSPPICDRNYRRSRHLPNGSSLGLISSVHYTGQGLTALGAMNESGRRQALQGRIPGQCLRVPLLNVFEDLRIAAAILDASGSIIGTTTEADYIDGFSVWSIGRKPKIDDQAADARFWEAVDPLVRSEPSSSASHLFVINSTRHRPLAIKAVPIRPAPLQYARDAKLLLIFVDLAKKPHLAAGLLRTLFNLTPAEARLTRALWQNGGVEGAANALGVSVGTARQTLKHIFDKTGAARQSELMSILTRLSVLGDFERAQKLR